jgi:hypothetical protein
MVGIVDDTEFQSAAIELRLSWVTSATLLLLVLLTLSPLLWFWTAGDRFLITRVGLACVCATPLVGVVLFILLACGMVTNRIDGHFFDKALYLVANRIVQLFDTELHADILALSHNAQELAEGNPPAAGTPSPAGNPPPAGIAAQELNQLEKSFYCDVSTRDLPYNPDRIDRLEPMFLMDDEGRQYLCRSGGALSRTPKLSLPFRGYFVQPREGALWNREPAARIQTAGCQFRTPQDEKSLIPCILGISANRPENHKQDVEHEEVPYYLERIDSIVRGDVQSVLAIRVPRKHAPVAVSGVRLNSLDRTVPPPHFDFAVVERDTGRTLFHSDDELAMATNFAADVGDDPALWALLRSGTRDTVSLVYAGIPIRAHVRPLREGTPWALVVYRGHELEDGLAAATTALSIFSSLSSLVIFIVVIVFISLMFHRGELRTRRRLPATIGRMAAMGARSTWMTGVICGLLMAFLLFSLWLAWGRFGNPWFLWNTWSPDGTGASSWGIFLLPVFAGVLFVLHCVCGKSLTSTEHGATFAHSRVLVLAAVIVCLAVVPAGLWFGHYRTLLGVGLNRYLLDRTLESVQHAREDYRLDMLREFGRGIASDPSQMVYGRPEGQKPVEGWIYGTLRRSMGFSKLSKDLMIYSTLSTPIPESVLSQYSELGDEFGRKLHELPSGQFPPSGIFLFLWTALAGALMYFIAWTISALCMVTPRRRGYIERLPTLEFDLLNKKDRASGSDPPLRAIVIYRNEGERKDFGDHLTGENSGVERELCNLDLDEILTVNAEGRAQFGLLKRGLKGNAPVLVWSRVMPDYKYVDRIEQSDHRLAMEHDPRYTRWRQWNNLAREFKSYSLPGAISEERSHFVDIWAQSTMDERLQMYAVVRSGVVDTRRTATLSSLVNRGIVEHNRETGAMWLYSEAFGDFVEHDVDLDELHSWRKAGDGGAWRRIWPPLAIGSLLVLAFLAMSNPEMGATLLTVMLGLLPTLVPFLRGGQSPGSSAAPSVD